MKFQGVIFGVSMLIVCAFAARHPGTASIILTLTPSAALVVALAVGVSVYGRIGLARLVAIGALRYAEWEERRQKVKRDRQFD